MESTLPTALAALNSHLQFILYRAVESKSRPGKTDKFPCSPMTGEVINAHDPAHWVGAEQAYLVASLFGDEYGVGFVLTDSDPFFCLDIDDCLTPQGWSKLALGLCERFPGAAVEVSRSGTGLHIWGRGSMPPHSCKNTGLGIELYHAGRFIALGLPNAVGGISADCTSALSGVVSQFFAATSAASTSPDEQWATEPCADWRGPAGDDELIRRMLAATPSTAAAFGGRATLADLWTANASALAVSYPSSGANQPYGESEADAALAAHLAWWAGKNCERMARLMLRSGLRREKYDREDYMRRTILNACRLSKSVYVERPTDYAGCPAEPVGPAPGADDGFEEIEPTTVEGRLVSGTPIVSPEQQITMWKGYTYVASEKAILTNKGFSLGHDQFKDMYGGNMFIMDQENGKMTSDAWEAFTQSRATRMPKAHHSAFRPDKLPASMWDEDDALVVNSYRKLKIPRKLGDASLFLNHLEKVLPIQRDRDILLSYMAAVVQYPGIKFKWAPLIQGTPGNGKTLFSECVARAVGQRYSHLPKAAEIAEKFNDWLVGKIFIGVEDVYYPEGRTEIIETLKPMITGSSLEIRAMHQKKRMMNICANFICNSNHKDAIRKTADDRRWCVMFTAQQSKEDKVRDGMTGAYFKTLYQWLEADGYAIVSEFLYTYKISQEFGLDCLLGEAPATSSTGEAIEIGLGRVEQEVVEAAAAGTMGFNGGWVTSASLDKMLRDRRMDLAMPRSKRKDMLESLGYMWHPALRHGRSSVCLPGTGERPIIFIKKGHWSEGLKTGAEIMKAYLAAQAPDSVELGAWAGTG